ncbi:MAG: hypothetical protein IPH10_13420 [bacterium]|nr:hypothetical protein [bacterium]
MRRLLMIAILYCGLLTWGCDKTCECTYSPSPTEPSDEASIVVTGPDSTVTAWRGHPLRITWTSANVVGSVKILYSRNDGDTWPFTIIESTINEGEFFWTGDAPLTRHCRVRIQTTGSPLAYGESPSSFTLQTYGWTIDGPASLFTVRATATNGVDLFAVGSGGSINQRFAATGEWSDRNSGTTRGLNDVHFVDQQVGWICGGNGVIRRTTNGGVTWSSIPSVNTIEVRAIHGFDSMTAMAASNMLWHTANAGASWDTVAGMDTAIVNRLFFHDSQRACAVGNNGFIAISEDGGETWAVRNSHLFATLVDVHSADGQTYYAVALEGQVVKSEDRGETWRVLDLDNAPALSSVRSRSALELLVATGDSRLLHSIDGGDTWVYYNVGSEHYFNTLLIEPTGDGWVGGSGNVLYRLGIVDSE